MKCTWDNFEAGASWSFPELLEREGKKPDEMRRRSPRQLIVQAGLHPNPGPVRHSCGFDDPEGPEWEDEPAVGVHIEGGDGPNNLAQPARSSREVAAQQRRRDDDSPRDVWEEMRKEWLEDKEHENHKQYLAGIGCPWVGASMRADAKGQAWRLPKGTEDDNSEDEGRPALCESSDEELAEEPAEETARDPNGGG